LVITPPKKTPEANVRYVIDIVKYGKIKGRPSGFTPLTVTAEYLTQNGGKVLVTGLNPNTNYKFTITAVNGNGDSKNAKGKAVAFNLTAKTAKFASPKKIKVMSATAPGANTPGIIEVTWKSYTIPGGSPITSVVLYTDKKCTSPVTAQTVTGIEATATGIKISYTGTALAGKGVLYAKLVADGVNSAVVTLKYSVS
jgi:hypothetical protein